MTIVPTPAPITGFPSNLYPISNITPFTYRDGATYLEVLELLRKYIRDTLVPFVDENFAGLSESWGEEVTDLITAVNTNVDENIGEMVSYVNLKVQEIIEASITVSDPVIDGVLAQPTSATRSRLALLFAAKSVQDALVSLTDTGRLSAASLNAAYAGKALETTFADYVTAQGVVNNGQDAKLSSIAIRAADYGAVGNGIADDTGAINSAIAACPDGGTVILRGTYKLTGSIVSAGKNVTIDARGATFIQTTAAPAVRCESSWSTSLSVLTVVATTVAVSAGTAPAMVLTLSGAAPAWKRGDIVKIWSDDKVVGSTTDVPSAPADAFRAGQFATVHSVSGSEVTIMGTARDPLTTGVRIAKPSIERINWVGGRFRSDYASPAMMFAYVGLLFPSVSDVVIENAQGQAFSMAGCFAYTVENSAVYFALDGGASYGYGVDDNTSEYGLVDGCRFFQPRHGYSSTSSTTTVGENKPVSHGRTYGTQVIDCVTISASSAAFDTHSTGQLITFDNCVSTDSPLGFQLRGNRNRVQGGAVTNAATAIRLSSDSASGESWGHSVDGVRIDGASNHAIEVVTRGGGTHPNFGVLDSRQTFINNVIADNVVNRLLTVINASVVASGIKGTVIGSPDSRSFVRVQNSRLRVNGGMHIDMYNIGELTGVGASVFWVTDINSILEVDKVKVSGSSNMATRLAKGIATDGTPVLRVDDMYLDHMPSLPHDRTDATSWVNYRASAVNTAASDLREITTNPSVADLIDLLARSTNPVIVAKFNIGTAQTLAALPIARQGQMLLLVNVGAGSITVQHGTTPKTALDGATNKVLTTGLSLMLVWDNSLWRQVKLV